MCRDRGSMTIWAAALAGLVLLGSSAALLYGSGSCGPAPGRDGGGLGGVGRCRSRCRQSRERVCHRRSDRDRQRRKPARLRGRRRRGGGRGLEAGQPGRARHVHRGGQGSSRSGGARWRSGDTRRGGPALCAPTPSPTAVRRPGSPTRSGSGASRRGRSGRRRCVVAELVDRSLVVARAHGHRLLDSGSVVIERPVRAPLLDDSLVAPGARPHGTRRRRRSHRRRGRVDPLA